MRPTAASTEEAPVVEEDSENSGGGQGTAEVSPSATTDNGSGGGSTGYVLLLIAMLRCLMVRPRPVELTRLTKSPHRDTWAFLINAESQLVTLMKSQTAQPPSLITRT